MAIFGAERFGTGEGDLLLGEEIDDGNGGKKIVGKLRTIRGTREANPVAPDVRDRAINVTVDEERP